MHGTWPRKTQVWPLSVQDSEDSGVWTQGRGLHTCII